ncbi:hypothetical protein HYU45_01260 [Candidatus Daviesbacteria bacterium]|nr:hypothetical protein [Candidatus Daviesbacteria bacterium]
MIIHKATCGLCKPTKKFKRNDTKIKGVLLEAMLSGDLTANLIKSYEKRFKQ